MVIAEHSVDLSLIKRDSKVLDLGCRSFSFANEMLKYVDEIYCVDADNSVKTEDPRIKLINVAISNENKITRYVKFGNGTGNYLEVNEPRPAECEVEYVQVWTLQNLFRHLDIHEWSLIKIDIEKSEIPVIKSLTSPPAKQLSIEFHKHCGSTEKEIQECFKKLETWYDCTYKDYSDKHGCGFNYWDTLWLRKDS